MSGVLAEFRKVFKQIFESGCVCGGGDPGACPYLIDKDYDPTKFGHRSDCHKVISARVLGYKVIEK